MGETLVLLVMHRFFTYNGLTAILHLLRHNLDNLGSMEWNNILQFSNFKFEKVILLWVLIDGYDWLWLY